jgi:hypothetical protein
MYLSIKEFDKISDIPNLYNFDEPCIIRGGCKNMSIFNNDNRLSSLYSLFKDTIIRVELYNSKENMMNTNYSYYKETVFSETYDYIINNKYPYHYIAEFNLCNDIKYPIIIPNFKNEIDYKRNIDEALIFFGNDSYSGCHVHGHNDYLLNQIYGTKTVYLFDYYDNNQLTKDVGLLNGKSNFTKENFFHLDHSKLKIYKVHVNEGDSLTIPPWWWHAVEGHEISFTITKTYTRSNLEYLTKCAS